MRVGVSSSDPWVELDADGRPIGGVEVPVAAEEFLLDDLGLVRSDITLNKKKHVMLVPFGENAWMVRLERFLLNREDEIERLVREEGRP